MTSVRLTVFLFLAFALNSIALADQHESVHLDGVWKATADTDGGEQEYTWTFRKDGEKFGGTSAQDGGDSREIDRVTVKDKNVTLEIDMEQDGNKATIKVVLDEKSAGKLSGKWSVVDADGAELMSGDISAAKEVAFAGEWKALSILPEDQEYESVVTLTGTNSDLKGSFEGEYGKTEVDKAVVSEDGLRMEFKLEMDGNTINCAIKAKLDGENKLDGKWVVIDEDGNETTDGKWSATRSPSLVGEWDVVATLPEGDDYNGTLTLTAENGKYAGTSKEDDGDASKLSSISVDGTELELSYKFQRGDYSGTIAVEAEQQDDGSLKGEWVATGSDGTELARDSWKAKKN